MLKAQINSRFPPIRLDSHHFTPLCLIFAPRPVSKDFSSRPRLLDFIQSVGLNSDCLYRCLMWGEIIYLRLQSASSIDYTLEFVDLTCVESFYDKGILRARLLYL